MNVQNSGNQSIFSLLAAAMPAAVAHIVGSPSYPNIEGDVIFYQTRRGVFIEATIRGLPYTGGSCDYPVFGFHIHSGGSCTGTEAEPFANAGAHYNPYGCDHPQHAGDLPPLFANRGYAWQTFYTERLNAPDVIGLPIIIHLNADDFTTQPSGNSGEMIACGIIESAC
ncbi:MAG: superoxide dismutase family protein [Eubacteriales bacterium]